MKNRFKDMSFAKKLKIVFGVVIVVPILCMGIYILYTAFSLIRKEQRLEVEDTVKRNIIDINNKVEQCENSINYLVSNYSLQEFLNIEPTEYVKKNEKAASAGSLIYNTLLSNQYFSKIYVYTDRKAAALSALVMEVNDAQEEKWYKETEAASGTLWWKTEDEMFITRSIRNYYSKETLAVIKINIDEGHILDESYSIFEGMPISIKISNGDETVAEYQTGQWEQGSKNYRIVDSLLAGNWKIAYDISDKYFISYRDRRLVGPGLVIVLLLIAVWMAVELCSNILFQEIKQLVAEVDKIGEGDINTPVTILSNDEIGYLAGQIDKMMIKMRRLINEVYKGELEKKDLELNLLQSKISPHFLYNNLSAINWIAIEKGEDQIYEITTQMAIFYRTALNKGKHIDKMRVEIENIKAYINLQLLAHENSFDVIYRMDDSLMECMTPIFIMQPLVENAIEHGIDQLREKRGKIEIDVLKEDGVIRMRVHDNGEELFRKRGTRELGEGEWGYGITNVHNRIRLLCGKEYGVSIRADEDGTYSEIVFREGYLKTDYSLPRI